MKHSKINISNRFTGIYDKKNGIIKFFLLKHIKSHGGTIYFVFRIGYSYDCKKNMRDNDLDNLMKYYYNIMYKWSNSVLFHNKYRYAYRKKWLRVKYNNKNGLDLNRLLKSLST